MMEIRGRNKRDKKRNEGGKEIKVEQTQRRAGQRGCSP